MAAINHAEKLLMKSDSFERTLWSDVVPHRPGTPISSVFSAVPTLDSVHEERSEEERQAARYPMRDSRLREMFEIEEVPLSRRSWIPRYSTTIDSPFLTEDSSATDIRASEFSDYELLETLSTAGSADEECLTIKRTKCITQKLTEQDTRLSGGLRRAMSSSSSKILRAGSKLKGVPSTLLTRSSSSKLTTKLPPVEPVTQKICTYPRDIPKRPRNIGQSLRSMLRMKENQRPR